MILPCRTLNDASVLFVKNLYVFHLLFNVLIFYCLFFRIKPALLRQATYGTIKIGIYYSLKNALIKNPHGKLPYYITVVGSFYYIVVFTFALFCGFKTIFM